MLNHAMVDIETLGGMPNAVILSIGAVVFDPNDTVPGDARFKAGVSIATALAAGQDVEGKTILWWLGQDDAARGAYLNLSHEPLSWVLNALRQWWDSHELEFIWGHGVNFDLKILDEAYRLGGQKPPWGFRAERDTRTLFHLYESVSGEKVEWDKGDTDLPKHDPLGDAIRQVSAVQWAWRRMGVVGVEGT